MILTLWFILCNFLLFLANINFFNLKCIFSEIILFWILKKLFEIIFKIEFANFIDVASSIGTFDSFIIGATIIDERMDISTIKKYITERTFLFKSQQKLKKNLYNKFYFFYYWKEEKNFNFENHIEICNIYF